MASVKCDDNENDIDVGYAQLVNKHIDKYERSFDENERNLNQYKHIYEVITINDDNDNNDDQKKSCDGIRLKSEPEIQQQSLIINDDIYTDLYKVWTRRRSGCAEPAHTYTCEWFACRYESSDHKLLKHHLLNEHIKTLIYVNYSRSFVSLNVYQYKCLRCDYETKSRDTILSHVCDHNRWKCLVRTCAKRFATKDELSLHHKTHDFLDNMSKHITGNTKPFQWLCPHSGCNRSFSSKFHLFIHEKWHKLLWKCFVNQCNKRFATKNELLAHKKLHTCLFDLKSNEYRNGNGVCSFAFIKKYYQKRRVIDGSDRNKVEYRYLCLWSECGYEAYHSMSDIQLHVHNSHTCPLIERVVRQKPKK